MQRTHRIALDVNNVQRSYLAKCAGTARFAYNWALAEWSCQYEAHKQDASLPKPNQMALRRQLNAIKRTQFPWMLEVSKCAPQEAIIDLGRAFENFFSGRAKYPVFHKKGVHDSFRISSGFFKVACNKLKLPHIGWVRMRECVRWEDAKVISVTISRSASRWFASVLCDIQRTKRCAKDIAAENTLGIDVGVCAYVDSDNNHYTLPRAYRKAERGFAVPKDLSHRQKGSANYKKQRAKVAGIHANTANIRRDWLHKLSSCVVANNAVIVIEDLNVKGMVKNRHLATSITDAAFGEFRRQLAYKSQEVGHCLIVADRFYPSSKLCSVCSAKTKHLPLSMRSWTCPVCGTKHDRDFNAARNLKAYAASSAVSACGEFLTADAVVPVGASVSSRLCEAGTKHQTSLE